MPRLSDTRLPKIQHHKARNRARVSIGGRKYDLGPYGSPEVKEKYDVLIAEWLKLRDNPGLFHSVHADQGQSDGRYLGRECVSTSQRRASMREREPKIPEINDTWYSIAEWSGEVIETPDIKAAKLALKEGREVVKNTRKVFTSGPTIFRMTATTAIKQVQHL